MIVGNLNELLQGLDPLTGLFRRDIVFDKLDEMLIEGNENRVPVIVIELHSFKHLNDGVGPEIGDRVIKGYAKRLQRASPDNAIIGRMGGDGFAIVLDNDQNLDEYLDNILDITSRPFSLHGNVIVVDSSMGVSIGFKDGDTAIELLRYADIALHSEKPESKKIAFFDESMLSDVRLIHILENDLRYTVVDQKPELLKAVASKSFEVYYQPQISTATLDIIGVEALIRWKHPERGYVSPEDFIPIAEDIGVIQLLGVWVLKKAMSDMQTLCKKYALNDFTVSVNVSPKQLEKASEFVLQLDNALEESNFPPEKLVLEITENAVLENKISEIVKITERGCLLALDDFGTGYASMNVLRSLPLYSAKLDQVFIGNLFNEDSHIQKKDEQVFKAFISMCNALDISTTIEGAETKEQCKHIIENGGNKIQGFYYSRPLPIDDLEQFIQKRKTQS